MAQRSQRHPLRSLRLDEFIAEFAERDAEYAERNYLFTAFERTAVAFNISETMSIIPKLSFSLNRRDEVPNQELAADIVKRRDDQAVNDLVCDLLNMNKGIRYDCIKVLYEIGYKDPKLIAEYLYVFLELLGGKDNRLQWGGMTAMACIVRVLPDEIFAALPKIIRAADKGSVITRDQCVNILISLSATDKYADRTFPLLLEQMMTCPTNQLPMYAENAVPVVNAANRDAFVKVLSLRLDGIEKESGRKRVEKVIKKVGK